MTNNLAAAVELVDKWCRESSEWKADKRKQLIPSHFDLGRIKALDQCAAELKTILAELGSGAGHSVLGIRVPKNRTDAELHYVEELGEDGKPTGYIWHPFRELENKLRQPVQDEDGYFPDETHIAAANAIANLRTALVSQIEITNTERKLAEDAAKALNQRPPVAGLADSQIMELWQAMNSASKFFCSNNKVPINEWAVSHEQAVLKAAIEFLGKVDG